MRMAFVVAGLLFPALAGVAAEASLTFSPTETNGKYAFNTGCVSGILRQGNKSIGLLPCLHLKTGTELSRSPGLVNFYRIFTQNHRFKPDARACECTTRLLENGALEIFWPAQEDRPFTMKVTYQWRDPQTLDLLTEVDAQKDLPDFEAFLSSYHAEGFPSTEAYARKEDGARFIEALPEVGKWQMLPRDEAAWKICRDGRWTFPPSPVDWARPADFAAPLVIRRHATAPVVIALMARPEDCISLSTCCQDEPHRSYYLSLFGRTIPAGKSDQVLARLMILDGDSNEEILKHYQAFINASSTLGDSQ